MHRAEDERLAAIGAAAASVLRVSDYHLARTEDIAAALSLAPGEGDGRSRGGRRSAVWVYTEVKSRRVLVALALHHAWRDYLAALPEPQGPERCATLADARRTLVAALLPIVRFHRGEARLVTQVGFGIGDIATTEKRRDIQPPTFPPTALGTVASEGFAMRVAVFAEFLQPWLRAAFEAVAHPTAEEVGQSARSLSNLVFRACLADPDGPVERTAEALAAFWFERDLVRLAGPWVLDLDGAERSLAAVQRRETDLRAESYARGILIRVLLEAGTLHHRGADEGGIMTARLRSLAEESGDRADLRALCDAASRWALSLRCYGDEDASQDAEELALSVASSLDDPSYVARAQTNLADGLSRQGDHERALDLLAEARATRARLLAETSEGSPAYAAAWRRHSLTEQMEITVRLRSGRVSEALRLAEELLDRRRGRDLPEAMNVQGRLLRAEALLATGHPAAAREAALEVYNTPHVGSATAGLRDANVVLLLAQVFRTSGRPDAAVRLLTGTAVLTPWFADRVSLRTGQEARLILAGALTDRAEGSETAEADTTRALELLDPAPDSRDPLAVRIRIARAAALLASGDPVPALAELPDEDGLPPLLAVRSLLVRAKATGREPLERALALSAPDPLHPLLLTARVALAEHLVAVGDLRAALPILAPFTDGTRPEHGRPLLGVDHPLLRRAVALLDRVGAPHTWGSLPAPLPLG